MMRVCFGHFGRRRIALCRICIGNVLVGSVPIGSSMHEWCPVTRAKAASATGRTVAVLLAILFLAGGCAAPVSVTRVDQRVVYRELSSSALSRDRLSEATRNTLRRHDLLAHFDADPAATITMLRAQIVPEQTASAELFALAEMSYLHARKSGDQSYYLTSAVYAFAFLFPGGGYRSPDPFDPRFREACDLYNMSLVAALKSADGGVVLRSGRYALPFGTLDVTLDRTSLRWGTRELNGFVPANDLRVEGIRNVYRSPGLGAPLAAGTLPLTPEQGVRVAPKLRLPVTALLLVPDARAQLARGHVRGSLSVKTIFDANFVRLDGQAVPLEYDQTAALALGLAESGVWSREYRGFLFGDLFDRDPATLVGLEPHHPGRVPVVFIHGTASSAGRWADMLNDLLDDPAIAKHFEFWFATYATGSPIAYSALLLREELQGAIGNLGGAAADPALGQMVLIGHSQGGLLAKLLVIDPGTRLWDGFSRKPLADLKATDATRDLARRMFFVHPLPEVRRVIFIATPQRGSYVAAFSISRLVARLVTAPLRVAQASSDVLAGNRDALAFGIGAGRFGSIYGMAPGSPLIRTLAPIPIAPSVKANSIIAVQGNGPVASGSDGVVTYASAHIKGVESELVVRSSHSTQSNPQTIAEVRRILLTHLAGACRQALSCTP
jgi:pimeloyl-ACP methyl ester carboxylesterase